MFLKHNLENEEWICNYKLLIQLYLTITIILSGTFEIFQLKMKNINVKYYHQLKIF